MQKKLMTKFKRDFIKELHIQSGRPLHTWLLKPGKLIDEKVRVYLTFFLQKPEAIFQGTYTLYFIAKKLYHYFKLELFSIYFNPR